MSIIQASKLSFSYDGNPEPVFENVSFEIDTDWKLGLIGRNGRGKSTLLKLMAGHYPYQGKINASVDFLYFPFGIKIENYNQTTNCDTVSNSSGKVVKNSSSYATQNASQSTAQKVSVMQKENAGKNFVATQSETVLEVVCMICPEAPEWKVRRELNLLDLGDLADCPFFCLSGGEKVRVQLAALFLHEGAYLLIDEPTNHLDASGRQLVAKYLNSKSGFLLVSHDRAFLDKAIDHVMSINKTGIEIKRGNFTVWNDNRIKNEQFEAAENEKLKKEIGRLEGAAARASGWSDNLEKTKYGTRNSGLRPDRGYIGHKSAKMMKRAKAMERRMENAIEEKSELLKDVETAKNLSIFPQKHHKNTLISVKNLCLFYGKTAIASNISFEVHGSEKVFLQGINGSGKSTLLKLIASLADENAITTINQTSETTNNRNNTISENVDTADSTNSDDIKENLLFNNVKFSLLPENFSFSGEINVASGLKVSYISQDVSSLLGSIDSFIETSGVDRTIFLTNLKNLDFSRELFKKQDISKLSEGQKKKLLIAKSLSENAHLYIWDEPLNFIDVLSRIQIETLIKNSNATILLVEHDRVFQDAVATETVML